MREYRPPQGGGVGRRLPRRARKSVASRYYQLLSGHAAIGPYPRDKIRKTDDDRCWCREGKKQTRHHLFTGCRAWRLQISRLWKDIGKAHGWKHPRAPSVKWLWKEKSTEACWFSWEVLYRHANRMCRPVECQEIPLVLAAIFIYLRVSLLERLEWIEVENWKE